MVESEDPLLEGWYFVSAVVRGGDLNGRIATWQLPAFGPTATIDPVNTPNLSMPVNPVAVGLETGSILTLDPADYGVRDWADLDGFDMSQLCVKLDSA